MQTFDHLNANTLDEAAAALQSEGAHVIAGGTDLIGSLKDRILPDYPETLVNLKTIPGLEGVTEEEGGLRIGALTRLADVAASPVVREKYTALAEAVSQTASPNIRNMATIGGNLLQRNRCWYFRKPENRFDCIRKGGDECFAETGDNRFHSAFGGLRPAPAPCTRACPAGTDIPYYLERIREGDLGAAAQAILCVNPMPMITSRVCAHFCQSSCNRGEEDESVSSSSVERVVGDFIREHTDDFYQVPGQESGKSAAIVGAGPAGLSAAYYLRRAGLAVTVYDAMEHAGGMLRYAIPSYRLPEEIVTEFTAALGRMGVVFRTGQKAGRDISFEILKSSYDYTLYATGTWKRPVIGIAGEELTTFGLDFLAEVKTWMRSKIGEEVFVAGGGNVAMDVAVTAKRLGAKSVTLACLEPRDRMPASSEEAARAEEEGVRILPSLGLSRVVQEGGVVTGIELKRCLSPWDETGAFHPQYDETDKQIIPAQNILMAVGQSADLSFLDEKYRIQLTQRGFVDVAPDTNMTSADGVFAAGDVTTGPATVIGAIAEGHKAARGILVHAGLQENLPAPRTGFLHFDQEGVLKKEALKLKELDAEKRRLDKEDSFTPSLSDAAGEARRCRNCACYAVSSSDTATALVALNAAFVTTRRTLAAEDFFAVTMPGSTILEANEILTEIQIPAPPEGAHSRFLKLAWRKAIDFPVVNCAVLTGTQPRICLGAVAPVPYRARAAEEELTGKAISEQLAAQAGEAAVRDADPFEATRYKVQIAKTLVKRALLKAAARDSSQNESLNKAFSK